jgi:hypothetical protein
MKQWAGWMCIAVLGCGSGNPSVTSPQAEYERAHCSATEGTSAPDPLPPSFAGASEVPVKELEARRISGEKMVLPEEETAAEIDRSGVHEIVAQFKLCMDTGGVPRYAKVLESSCYPRYDAKIADALGKWRYSPFIKDGVPAPVCTAVTFIYRLN